MEYLWDGLGCGRDLLHLLVARREGLRKKIRMEAGGSMRLADWQTGWLLPLIEKAKDGPGVMWAHPSAV